MEVSGNKAAPINVSLKDAGSKEIPEGASVSHHFEPRGHELIDTVVRLSGLEENSVRRELESILSASGHLDETSVLDSDGSSEFRDLTIEDLRASMLRYLEEMNRTMTGEE